MKDNYNHYIGTVKQVTADDINENSVVLYDGKFQSVSVLEKVKGRVRISFDYLRASEKWDLDLTNSAKTYILGTIRVTGLKEGKK